MKMRLLLALAIAMLAPSGCADRTSGNSEAGAAAGAGREDANFRYLARGVYEALLTESCPPNRTLPRARVLTPEIAAVRAFERRTGSGPARFHVEIARHDIAYRQASGALGCLDDSDRRFAALHVERARDRVRLGLREMETLAPRVTALPASLAALPPSRSAEFRSLVRTAVENLQPLCAGPDSDRILAPARAELARFRRRLEDTPYALHFDLARADGLYERSITVAECIDAAPRPAAEASRAALQETRGQIARIAAFARLGSPSRAARGS